MSGKYTFNLTIQKITGFDCFKFDALGKKKGVNKTLYAPFTSFSNLLVLSDVYMSLYTNLGTPQLASSKDLFTVK